MNFRAILVILVLSLIVPTNANLFAQESTESYLKVVSDPSGAIVHLKGEYNLILTTPSNIHQELNGEYKVRAFKRGYEKWNSRVWFGQGNPRQLAIQLKSKTRLKAGSRSLLIPGWGQFYCEEKTKSFIMGISTVGAVVAYILADNDYSNKYDDYIWAKNQLDNAENVEDWRKYKQLLDERQREAYNAENLKRATLGITIGIWAYNVLDAILFFPYSEEQTFTNRNNLTLKLQEDRPSLVFTKKF